jgi:hypothetical protein
MINVSLITLDLGVQLHCTSHGLLLHQIVYVHNILAVANMEDSQPTLVPYQDGIIFFHFMGSSSIDAKPY